MAAKRRPPISFSRHKRFYTGLFVLLSIIFVLVGYTAVQQQQVFAPRAVSGCAGEGTKVRCEQRSGCDWINGKCKAEQTGTSSSGGGTACLTHGKMCGSDTIAGPWQKCCSGFTCTRPLGVNGNPDSPHSYCEQTGSTSSVSGCAGENTQAKCNKRTGCTWSGGKCKAGGGGIAGGGGASGCKNNNDCKNNSKPVCDSGKCVECKNKNQCKGNKVCKNNKCVAPSGSSGSGGSGGGGSGGSGGAAGGGGQGGGGAADKDKKCREIQQEAKCKNDNDCKWFTKCNKCANKSKTSDDVCGPPTATPTTPSTSPGPTAGDVVLNLNLSFQGITARPSGTEQMDVKVILTGGALDDQRLEQTGEFTVDDNGIWNGQVTFTNITPGNGYKVLVKGPKHIQKKICDMKPDEAESGFYRCSEGKITLTSGENNFDFSGIRLPVGDLPDQDGVIDAYDISFLRNSLNKKDDEILAIGDLNLDGIVDTQDYALLLASLTVKYDEE